ncbi:hypothetical protein [Oceanicella actignis]|uniref:hypothetical protein n=1 Tax=Oceanicella actignis TaxID=1189325 RepID=UPI0011E8772C|nr:hypothetical protein [Oceanicella actignis]TYO89456.1 hypothetical protein LY05_01444 [Oceanicella actignis]
MPARPLRRPGARPLAAAFMAVAAGLAGCGNDYVRIEALSPSVEPEPAPKPAPREALTLKPVEAIELIELGVTRDGALIHAVGLAPTTRWFAATLRPRGGGAPAPDGFLEFDFLAAPPELNGGAPGARGLPAQRRLQAALPLSEQTVRGAAGVRVFAAQGAAAARF